MPISCCLKRTRTPPPGEQQEVARLGSSQEAVSATPVATLDRNEQNTDFQPVIPVNGTASSSHHGLSYPTGGYDDDDRSSVHSLGSISVARSVATSTGASRKRRIVRGVLDLRPAGKKNAYFYERQMIALCKTMHNHKQSIRVLLLGRNNIDDKAARLLSDFVSTSPVLEYLELTSCNLSEQSLVSLMKRITGMNSECRNLVSLNLAANNINGRSAVALTTMLSQVSSPIQNLLIHHNPLTIRGVATLLQCPKLRILDTRKCFSPPPVSTSSLVESQTKKWQTAWSDGFTSLCANVQTTKLVRFDLRDNNLEFSHIESLKHYASHNPNTYLIFDAEDAAAAPPLPKHGGEAQPTTPALAPEADSGNGYHSPIRAPTNTRPPAGSPLGREGADSPDVRISEASSEDFSNNVYRPTQHNERQPQPNERSAQYQYDSEDDENFSYEPRTDGRKYDEYDDYVQYSPSKHRPKKPHHRRHEDREKYGTSYAESPDQYYNQTSFDKGQELYSSQDDDNEATGGNYCTRNTSRGGGGSWRTHERDYNGQTSYSQAYAHYSVTRDERTSPDSAYYDENSYNHHRPTSNYHHASSPDAGPPHRYNSRHPPPNTPSTTYGEYE